MNPVFAHLRRERLWPYLVALLGLLVILPGIHSFGFWEPHEIQAADRARERRDTYTINEINAETAKQFRIQPNMLASGRPQQARPRAVALHLARRFTPSKSLNALRRLYKLRTTAEVRESIAQAKADPGLQKAGSQIEVALAKRADEPGRDKDKTRRPPLTDIMVDYGMRALGTGELGARLPLALLGLITLMATFFLGLRLRSPRAGLISAAVLVSFPLFLLQSRQITSDIGAVAGQTLMMLGLVGMAWPRPADRKRFWLIPIDFALVALGTALAYLGAATLLGVFVPFAAIALAGAIALALERRAVDPASGPPTAQAMNGERRLTKLQLIATTLFAAALAVATLAWVLSAIFDLKSPVPGDRELFGRALHSSNEYIEALGGVWRKNGDPSATFDSLFEQLAYGLFPWVALAPIAVVHLAMGPRQQRRGWAGYAIFAWALLAWVVATVMSRKVGDVHYPALAAVALAIGIWLDELISAREQADAVGEDDSECRRRHGFSLRMPLVGLFGAACAVVLAKDLQPFTNQLMNVHLLGSGPQYPKDLSMKVALLVFAVLFALALASGLARWRRVGPPRGGTLSASLYHAGRWGLGAAVGIGVIFAIFLAHYWTPKLSSRLSSKGLFAAYQSRASSGDLLGVMGHHGSAPDYYIDTDYIELRNRGELINHLQSDKRVFAIVRANELCAVHRASADKLRYHVLYDENVNYLLMSNQLGNDKDRNPLLTAITRARPDNIENPTSIIFDNKIELIGYNAPRRVARGDTFKMTLFYRVLSNVSGGSWKIFVHFDTRGMRFQGDHDPIRGRCSTAFWQKGDYIIDEFEVEAGTVTHPKGAYNILTGFFYGSHGNWRNMPITKGPKDNAQRARLGVINVGSKPGGCSAGSGGATGVVALLLVLLALFGPKRGARRSRLHRGSSSGYDPI